MEDPAVGDEGGDADGHDGEEGLETGSFDGEVAEVVAALAVDWEVELSGCAFVEVVEEFAVEDCC